MFKFTKNNFVNSQKCLMVRNCVCVQIIERRIQRTISLQMCNTLGEPRYLNVLSLCIKFTISRTCVIYSYQSFKLKHSKNGENIHVRRRTSNIYQRHFSLLHVLKKHHSFQNFSLSEQANFLADLQAPHNST